jgi:hypothetical protein
MSSLGRSSCLFRWKRAAKKYLITYPMITACLATSLSIYFTYYGIQQSTNDRYPLDASALFASAKFMRMIPSAGYSLLIIPINLAYRKLATRLTDFGRHRIEHDRRAKQRHRCVRSFVN